MQVDQVKEKAKEVWVEAAQTAEGPLGSSRTKTGLQRHLSSARNRPVSPVIHGKYNERSLKDIFIEVKDTQFTSLIPMRRLSQRKTLYTFGSYMFNI